MGDMGDFYRDWEAHKKARRKANMASFDPSGWTCHTPYHYSRELTGKRLDYWPSKKKWMYDGKVQTGNVDDFIQKRQRARSGDAVSAEDTRPVLDAGRVSTGQPDDVEAGPPSFHDTGWYVPDSKPPRDGKA